MGRVDSKDARQFAESAFADFIRIGEGAPEHLRQWSIGNLPEAGTLDFEESGFPIFDLNGQQLFRDFHLRWGDGSATVRTSADDRLPSPVWSVGIFDTENLKERIASAEAHAEKFDIGLDHDKRIYCYSYPKLGLRGTKGEKEVIVELYPPHFVIDLSQDLVENPEVVFPWSILDLAALPSFRSVFREQWQIDVKSFGEKVEAGPPSSRLFDYVEEAREGSEEQTLPLRLRGQETPVYCAVATAQMILEYHGVREPQSRIATEMSTGSGGTTNPNQVIGYNQLLSSHLATFDGTASFAEARNEIVNARPCKSGIPGHARALGGFRVRDDDIWVYIYDPWPVNQGRAYWENWTASNHYTNYIYVRRRTFQ